MVNSLSWFCYHILNEVSCTDYVSFEMRLKDPDSGAYLDPFNFDFETYDVFIYIHYNARIQISPSTLAGKQYISINSYSIMTS